MLHVMSGFERPTDFREAMDIARLATDPRDNFEVYQDVARRVVQKALGTKLNGLPISEDHKRQIIEAEAYSRAQPVHLHDAAVYQPNELLKMLEELGVIGIAELHRQ